MAIALAPGPVELLDVAELLEPRPAPELEDFVAGRVADFAGAHDRLAANLRSMAHDLDGDREVDLDPTIALALGDHEAQLAAPAPDFQREIDVTQGGLAALGVLAADLPPDDTPPFDATVDLSGDGFDATAYTLDGLLDYLDGQLRVLAARINAPSPGGGSPGSPGGGSPGSPGGGSPGSPGEPPPLQIPPPSGGDEDDHGEITPPDEGGGGGGGDQTPIFELPPNDVESNDQ